MQGENTYDKTQQVVEDGNRFSDNPRDNPNTDTDSDPGSNGEEATAVHLVRAAEHTHVDVLAGDVAQDDAGENDLYFISMGQTWTRNKKFNSQ